MKSKFSRIAQMVLFLNGGKLEILQVQDSQHIYTTVDNIHWWTSYYGHNDLIIQLVQDNFSSKIHGDQPFRDESPQVTLLQ